MNEDSLNMDIRKFLKKVGISSQREIDQAVHKALEMGLMKDGESISLKVSLSCPELAIDHQIEDKITLQP
jgi:hypothetical protein